MFYNFILQTFRCNWSPPYMGPISGHGSWGTGALNVCSMVSRDIVGRDKFAYFQWFWPHSTITHSNWCECGGCLISPLINSLDPYNNNPENPILISLLVQKLWPFKVLVPIMISITIKFSKIFPNGFDSLQIVTRHHL